MKYFFSIILLLIFTTSLFADQTIVWNPAGNPSSTGLWSEADNWAPKKVPEGDTIKVVFNVADAQDCILDEAHLIKQLVMGDNDSSAAALLVSDGGTLTTGSVWSAVGYNDYAKMVVETGGEVTFGSHLWLSMNPGADGILIVDGGTVNVSEMFGIRFQGNVGGKGAVYVKSGVLNLAQLHPTQSFNASADSAMLDITGGTVVLNGDKSADINKYIAAGNITAYGGAGEVVVTVADGKTTLVGLPGEPISTLDHLIFDGVDDYVNAGNHDAVNVSGSELTLEAWIKANAWRDNVWQGCVINTESAPNNGYMIRAGGNGLVNFNVGNEGWNEINTAEGAVQLDTWHHIAATFNAGVMTIYIDGVEAVTANKDTSVTMVGVATTPTAIGNWGNLANPGRSFDGAIIDARIWNVARSAEDIMAYKDVKLTGSEEGLVGYWPMNEGDGQTVADLTGNSAGGQLGSIDGPDENDPTWFGQIVVPPLDVRPVDYLVFDGTSQYVDAGTPPALDITGTAITLEALINMTEWRDNVWQGCIINKEQGEAGNEMGYMLRAGNGGTLNFNIGATSWHEINSDSAALDLNNWHHVAGTYDGATQKLYIDGHLVASAEDTFSVTSAGTNPLFIGSNGFGANDRTIIGSMSEVRIWTVARTQQEIVDNMNGSLNGDESGLVAYWKIDEGEGQTVTDLTTNALVGQLGSTPDEDANDPAWGPVTVERGPGAYLPEFPPKYFQGPFPYGIEDVRFDAPLDLNAPTGDGVYHEYTAYRGTPNYDDGNLDEEVWNKIPWTLLQFNNMAAASVYNIDSSRGWSGYSDHTAWFKMLHDDNHIYLAVMKVDELHTWSDEAWNDTFFLWQCDAIQMQFDARAPGVFDDPMPQAEIGLGEIDGEAAYHYWAGGPGDPVINQQLELAPGSSESSFASVNGKALHTAVVPHPEQDGLLLETIEVAFLKWDDIQSDDDFAMMMSIITLDRDIVGAGRPDDSVFTVFEFGRGLFAKNRTDYASLVLSASEPVSDISELADRVPGEYSLQQNYPNPFNPSTTINFSLAKAGNVNLKIYDILGREVKVLVDQKPYQAGTYQITFDASQLSSGIYFYQLNSGDFKQTKKMMLLK